MGRANSDTLLPLLTWAEIMGISPWRFAQMNVPDTTRACKDVWYQSPWQKDYLSRDEIGQAILTAESMFARQAGFWPAPRYITRDIVTYPRNVPGRVGITNMTSDGDFKAVASRWKRVIGGGIRTRTLIDAGAVVVLSDRDGDTVRDTFTLTVPTSITDASEIGVYFTATDRLNAPIDETWRLRPLEITFAGGTATIKGHIALAVLPVKTLGANPQVLSVADNTNFAATLAVYRVYRDATHTEDVMNQGYAMWQVIGCADDDLSDECLQGVAPICIGDSLSDMGRVFVQYDLCSADFEAMRSEPNKLSLNYLAGYPLSEAGTMDVELAQIVAYLATSLLPDGPCGCERTDRIIAYWRGDVDDRDEGRFVAQQEAENPFGRARGALFAWNRLLNLNLWDSVGV